MAEESRSADVLISRHGEALVAIPGVENGEAVVYYRLENGSSDPTTRSASIERALAAAGSWANLDVDETLDALDEIRHSNPPSPPFELDD